MMGWPTRLMHSQLESGTTRAKRGDLLRIYHFKLEKVNSGQSDQYMWIILEAPSQAEIHLHLVRSKSSKEVSYGYQLESIWKIQSALGGLIKKDNTDFVTLFMVQRQASFGLATVIQAFRNVRSNIYRRLSQRLSTRIQSYNSKGSVLMEIETELI